MTRRTLRASGVKRCLSTSLLVHPEVSSLGAMHTSLSVHPRCMHVQVALHLHTPGAGGRRRRAPLPLAEGAQAAAGRLPAAALLRHLSRREKGAACYTCYHTIPRPCAHSPVYIECKSVPCFPPCAQVELQCGCGWADERTVSGRGQVFIPEQQVYSKQDLERHMRTGDSVGPLADTGFKGHPQCRFCRKRFYGDGELFQHMQARTARLSAALCAR